MIKISILIIIHIIITYYYNNKFEYKKREERKKCEKSLKNEFIIYKKWNKKMTSDEWLLNLKMF